MKEKSFYFQWHITDLCNFRCRHCYQSNFSSQSDLDLEGLKKIADNILSVLKYWNKRAIINITGGEPLLKQELFPLLEYLDHQKAVKELAVITNASILDRNVADRLANIKKLDEVKISLEGATESSNDAIRGKGAFKKALAALKLLKPHKNIEKTIMFTMLRRNLSEVNRLLELAEENGANGVILERFIPWGRGQAIKAEVLSREEWSGAVNRLLQFLEIPFSKEIFSYKAFWVRFGKTAPQLFGAPCVAADGGVCIMPNGDVYPCRRFNLKIGNLLQNRLDEIYNGSEVLKDLQQRGKLKGKCNDCVIKSCKGCRALVYATTGDYLGEDIQCFYERGEFVPPRKKRENSLR